jgi:hypothetical protein|tara:strand:+ start:222 stop:470 length:249 start_codon:yes stop_codon:yes gene_type:complete
MAAKGSAAKSASGASMSKYDVEVEARLRSLEAKAHTPCGGSSDDRIAALEAKVDALVSILNTSPAVTEYCPKDANGERKISL